MNYTDATALIVGHRVSRVFADRILQRKIRLSFVLDPALQAPTRYSSGTSLIRLGIGSGDRRVGSNNGVERTGHSLRN